MHFILKLYNSVEGFGNAGLLEEHGVAHVLDTTARNTSLEALLPLSVSEPILLKIIEFYDIISQFQKNGKTISKRIS